MKEAAEVNFILYYFNSFIINFLFLFNRTIENSTRFENQRWRKSHFCLRSSLSLGSTISRWPLSSTTFSAFSQIGWLPCLIAVYRHLRFVNKFSQCSKRFGWNFIIFFIRRFLLFYFNLFSFQLWIKERWNHLESGKLSCTFTNIRKRRKRTKKRQANSSMSGLDPFSTSQQILKVYFLVKEKKNSPPPQFYMA